MWCSTGIVKSRENLVRGKEATRSDKSEASGEEAKNNIIQFFRVNESGAEG